MSIVKFFKEFAGNKTAFVAKGYDTKYANHICLIKDSANNGAGACIYARGMYFANFQELISALAFVKGVKVGSDSYNAANGGGYVEFAVTDPSKVSLDVQNGKLTFGLTPEFVNSVNSVIEQAATIAGDYLKAADRTALEGLIASAKAEAIAEVKGNAQTDTKDSKTIEGVRKYVDAKTADIASGEAFSTLKGRVDAIEGDYLKEADKTALQGNIDGVASRVSTIEGDYLKKADKDALSASIKTISDDYLKGADKTELQGGINTNAAAISVLEGADKGKSVRGIVQDEVAAQLKSENISESFDTLKEMAEYLSSHPESVTEMNAAIQQNAKDIDAIEAIIPTLATDSKAQGYANAAKEAAIADADAKLANKANVSDVYTKTEANNLLNAKADAADVYGKSEVYTKAEANTELGKKANAADVYTKTQADELLAGKAAVGASYTKSEADALLNAKANSADVYAKTEVYTKAEVESMFAWEVLE